MERPSSACRIPGVGDVHLRRAYLPFADVFVPRLQLSHDEDRSQEVQVASHGRVGDTERPAEFGAIPGLTVPVGEHRPEAAQCGRRDGAPELRNVTGEESPDEAVPPAATRRCRAGEIGEREPAAQPQPLRIADLLQPEAVQFMECNAPGEGLGGLTEQFGRGAPEHKEPGWRTRPVREYAQQWKHLGQSLDLVQNHEPSKGSQLESGIGEPGEVGGVLEVEPHRRTAARCHQLPGQGGLPYLPRAEKGHDRKLLEQQAHATEMVLTGNFHGMEI